MDTRKQIRAASAESPPRLVRSHTDIGAPGKRWQLTNIYRGYDKYGDDRDHHGKHQIQDIRPNTARIQPPSIARRPVEDVYKGASGSSPGEQSMKLNNPSSIPPRAARTAPLLIFEKSLSRSSLALEEERFCRRQE